MIFFFLQTCSGKLDRYAFLQRGNIETTQLTIEILKNFTSLNEVRVFVCMRLEAVHVEDTTAVKTNFTPAKFCRKLDSRRKKSY